MYLTLLVFVLSLSLTRAAETVLGVYIFSRHGDRTAKSTPPANLTDLGYQEIFTSGTYFRNRYIASNASSRIEGINDDLVKLSQLAVSAPLDNVLMSSAVGFLQGLYPPVGSTLGANTLRNGTVVQSPLNGYQIIPVQQTTSGTGSENAAWLQGSSNCANALISSNNYFESAEYTALLKSTQAFYNGLAPMINGTFAANQTSFKNAYTSMPFYLPIDSIHNTTFNSSSLLTDPTFFQLRTLADNHEWNLAFNASDSIRAIAGQTLAGQIVQALNGTIASEGKSKLNIQLGAYNAFQSFFGLANLTGTAPGDAFFGVPDYASTMTFELFTDAAPSPFPAATDLQVRFLFHNGTTSPSSTPTAYPLFGQSSTALSWSDFTAGMNKFAIGDQASWCSACGNTTGVCAPAGGSSSNSSSGAPDSGSDSSDNGSGLTVAVAGVIGAMVTLAVILGLEALILLIGGLRVVSKRRLGAAAAAAANAATGSPTSSGYGHSATATASKA